jgi:mycothiol S-conjugate amidase
VAVAAFDAAGDPARHPDAGEPFQPLKLYYFASFSRSRLLTLHEGTVEHGLESTYAEWLKRWDEESEKSGEEIREPAITTQVDVGKWLPQARDALIAHASQIDPNGFWFAIPDEVVADIYPWEDYTLARSLLPTPLPERDLFATIDEDGLPLR